MRRFVEDALEQDRHLFEKDGHVVVLENGGDARVALDHDSMRMVLGNLIENAARYSPRGSTIRLRLHRDLRSCKLDVMDNGVGISRKDLKNIFKMFWRGHESRVPGTGLGLFIVRHIVRDHKGKVWATSPGPGRGSTFSLSLPRVRQYWGLAARRDVVRAKCEERPPNAQS
jgi:signal transduction histidine kinase